MDEAPSSETHAIRDRAIGQAAGVCASGRMDGFAMAGFGFALSALRRR